MILFATEKYEYLKKGILTFPRFEEGSLTRKKFPDGERYLKINSEVRNKNVTIIGGTCSDEDTLEIFDLACTLVQCGARTLSLVIPYFGYSTMEIGQSGEVITAKTRARLLSTIPKAFNGNKIFLFDLHSEGIPSYFEGDVNVVHLYAKDLVIKMVKKFTQGETDFVLASTDAGRAKWVESLGKDIGCHVAFVYKHRSSGSETEVTGVNANVLGKHVIIYDDMIRTGGSLIQAAQAYKQAGATKISAITTHSLFPDVNGKSTVDKLSETGLFHNLGTTNSHPRVNEADFKDILIEDVSELFARALLNHS
jgi:ribose-phosphate pyrophosphokinase